MKKEINNENNYLSAPYPKFGYGGLA